MTPPVLVPAWILVAFVLSVATISVAWHVASRLLQPHDVRWVLAASCGACVAGLLAPSPWIAGVLLSLALSIPVSLLAFQHHRSTLLGFPPTGATILAACAVWVVALGLLTAALRETGAVRPFVVGLLILAAYNTLVGWIQVRRGIHSVVWHDAAFGEPRSVVRAPIAFLHSTWKPAAINALLLPAAIGLAWPLSWWTPLCACLAAGMVWQLHAAEGDTCLVSAGVGVAAALLGLGLVLPVVIGAPLGIIAYPTLRARLRSNPRWEAWGRALDVWRKTSWLGAGLGAWQGLHVQTSSEPGRKWHTVHNDWLETLVECGPLPVLCAMGYLGTAVVRVAGGVSPLEAGLFGSLVALAVLSAGYMPWRTWPVNLFALGILASWEALGR